MCVLSLSSGAYIHPRKDGAGLGASYRRSLKSELLQKEASLCFSPLDFLPTHWAKSNFWALTRHWYPLAEPPAPPLLRSCDLLWWKRGGRWCCSSGTVWSLFSSLFCSLPVVDETLLVWSTNQRAAQDGSSCARGLGMLSGTTVKRERGAPRTKAHPCKACCTGLEKGSRLLHFTVPTLNTFALLIVFNAQPVPLSPLVTAPGSALGIRASRAGAISNTSAALLWASARKGDLGGEQGDLRLLSLWLGEKMCIWRLFMRRQCEDL